MSPDDGSFVLTARHCVQANAVNGIVIHVQSGQGEARVLASHYEVADRWDVALVGFPPSEAIASLGVQPLLPNAAAVDETRLGRAVTLGGFGKGDDGERGVRQFVNEPIAAVETDFIVVDGEGNSGACAGDSGGPLLDTDSAGGVMLVGVLSGGSSDCKGQDRYVRVDRLVDNCIILGIDPHVYLVNIITKLESGWPMARLSELTPANWFAQQAVQQRVE